jgi:sugar-specific transcriptional regulator TrmB
MTDPKDLLTQFSITGDEADVYLALLKLGVATATDIANKVKKNRTATHFHLKKLVDKSLINQTKRGRTFVFSAVNPSQLATRFDRLTTDFKSLVPQLEASTQIEKEEPRVQVSESRSGYYKVYDEISSLPENSTFFAIEGALALKNELTLLSDKEITNFYQKIIERKISTKLIMTKEAVNLPNKLISSENLTLLKERILAIRTYPEQILLFQGLSLSYGNTVAYLFTETNLVITITHKGIADAFRASFEALFEFGESYTYSV